MSNYNVLKSSIQEVIKQNGRKEITGQLLQQTLIAMVNSLGVGYQFEGVATPETNPGSVDQKTFYVATAVGTYANMGGASLTSGQVGVFMWADSWTCVILDIPTKTYVDGQIQTITIDIQGLANAIGELQTTVSGIGNTVSGLVTDVSGLKNNVQTINGQITQINTDLGNKVDKVTGMGLSHNDLTDALKNLIENAVQSAQIVQVIGDDVTKIISQAGIKAILEGYAKISGHYPLFTAGAADNIVGDPIAVTSGYTEKPLALGPNGEMNEVADGRVVMNEVRGRAMAWNQLAPLQVVYRPDFVTVSTDGNKKTYTRNGFNLTSSERFLSIGFELRPFNTIVGHKYLIKKCWTSNDSTLSLRVRFNGTYYNFHDSVTLTCIASDNINNVYSAGFIGNTEGSSVTIENDCIALYIDLTLEFGAGHEPATVEQAEAMLASRRRLKPYFPFNAGTLLGARLLGWSMPRTANLLNPTTKNARLVSYTNPGNTNNEYTIIGFDQLTGAAIQFTPDATGVAESVTIDAENHFVIPGSGTLEIVASGQDPIGGDMEKVCVYMTWDGSMDDKVVAYNGYNAPFDSANVYHKSGDVYTQVFEDGVMRATGDGASDVRDEIGYDEVLGKCYAKTTVGDVDIKNLELTYNVQNHVFRCAALADRAFGNVMICGRLTASSGGTEAGMDDKTFLGYSASNTFAIKDTAYSDSVQFKNAYNGVHLWYKLATPTIYTSDLYYKTGEDTYVPLGEVWPLVGFGCNWATETLEEQADDANGQPTSITPETVENFTTDLKEAIKTLIDAQEDNVDLTLLRANLVAMCEAMKQGGVVANYTISENATGGVFAFTFTPNA